MYIKFLGEEYDLSISYGRKLLHQEVDTVYETFLTTDEDEDENITRYYLENDTNISQIELQEKIKRNIIFDYDENINVKDYKEELKNIHKLISNKDAQGLLRLDSNYYNTLFEESLIDVFTKEFLNQEIKLVDFDNKTLKILEEEGYNNCNSIFDYDVYEMLENSFSYMYNKNDGYNFYIEVIEDNNDELEIIIKITNIETI